MYISSITEIDNNYMTSTTMYPVIIHKVIKYCVGCKSWTWQVCIVNTHDATCEECGNINDYFLIPEKEENN